MTRSILMFGAGVILAIFTLRDVFDTVVVPGESRGPLRIAHRVVATFLPVWKLWRRRGRRISKGFAPFVLVTSFVVWMLLLGLSFGLMAYALPNAFHPPLQSFDEAAYVAGSNLVTLGLSGRTATGGGRWVSLGAGFCGLGVVTLAVAYLLEMQGSIAQRDAAILKVRAMAADPPTAIALLERYGQLHCHTELTELLRNGREWCATVLQSHAAHPSLIYFRSVAVGAGWPATLCTFLDLALILEKLVTEPDLRGGARLLRDEGTRMAEVLMQVIRLELVSTCTDAEAVNRLRERLVGAGYRLRDCDALRFLASREKYAACIAAIAAHLGSPLPRLA